MTIKDIKKAIRGKPENLEFLFETEEGKCIELDSEIRSEIPEPPSMFDDPVEYLIIKKKEDD